MELLVQLIGKNFGRPRGRPKGPSCRSTFLGVTAGGLELLAVVSNILDDAFK